MKSVLKISDGAAASRLHREFLGIEACCDSYDAYHCNHSEAVKYSTIILCQNGYRETALEIAAHNGIDPVLEDGTCGILRKYYEDLDHFYPSWMIEDDDDEDLD